MMVIGELYTNTKNLLKRGGISNYRKEAAYLLEHFLHVDYRNLALNGGRMVDGDSLKLFQAGVNKRLSGYPLQYILGCWEFYGLDILVGEGVLIPRSDTEALVDFLLEESFKRPGKALNICDLCSGTGCIPIALEQTIKPPPTGSHRIWAVENSEEATQYFKSNAKRHMSKVKLEFRSAFEGDLAKELPLMDIISCNPPYLSKTDMEDLQSEVSYEPEAALFGGDDGLDYYRKLIPIWWERLAAGGVLAFEVGQNQHEAVGKLLLEAGLSDILYREDLTGIIRVVAGYRQ